jgi:hypothetical protein
MTPLLALFQRAGVKAMFSGHEHNFQHSTVDGIDYFVTGGAARTRSDPPRHFAAAGTRSWSAECHFLLVRIEGARMHVRAVGEATSSTPLPDIERHAPDGTRSSGPIEVHRL